MLVNAAPIHPLDIPFQRAPVWGRSSSGLPYLRWITHGMPKLGQYQYLLDIVFFLYPDEESAKRGEKAGGTGFFVAIPSETYPQQYHHAYAVTNWHVAVDGSPVIRVNKKSGAPEILPVEPHEWIFIPGFHDIAVLPVTVNADQLKVEAIEAKSFFLTEEDINRLEINAADDVFMLGRFIDYDGLEANCPSMRFGNISMMAANVPQQIGFKGPSIVVDMHSRTGFSGSPVFVYRTGASSFGGLTTSHLMKILGILWGQFPEDWDIRDKPLPRTSPQTAPVTLDGKSIKGWSGMSLVCPAAAIWKVLNVPALRERRSTIDNELHKMFANAPVVQSK